MMADDPNQIPRIYNDILVFKSKVEFDDGEPVIKTGGPFNQPNLPLAHLYAARCLLAQTDSAGELVRTVAYLQRHALELSIKRLIDLANDVYTARIWVAALKSDPTIPSPLRPTATATHDLGKLTKEARVALARLDRTLPDELESWAKTLTKLEGASADRWRYAHKLSGAPTFPEAIRIPIYRHQRELEALFERHLWFQGPDEADAPNAPLFAQLVLEEYSLTQMLIHIGAMR